ncbi:hypothetical protein CAG70_06390 [Photobacterium halotolerans]|uniref:hypothetical protein n=1 Tax=Photobacterium halotolerans TaxID=265726 RepID=UPI001372BEC5|nr:hypothetical protein [Photobacterium halotolerans]NAX46627.1 hypothetical protein [Photobacterium halotolerans]
MSATKNQSGNQFEQKAYASIHLFDSQLALFEVKARFYITTGLQGHSDVALVVVVGIKQKINNRQKNEYHSPA